MPFLITVDTVLIRDYPIWRHAPLVISVVYRRFQS